MTDQTPHDPAETAAIDQLLAGFGTKLDRWVAAMQDQTARHGPDQALANVMLALNLERMDLAGAKALLIVALQRLATPPTALAVAIYGKDGVYAAASRASAEGLLGRLKQIEDENSSWNGDATVSILAGWFTEMGIDIDGPGPYSCTECGHIDQPHYWHVTAEHTQRTLPDDEEAGDLEGDEGEGYDTSSLAKEDERNAWRHTIDPDAKAGPEDGADYTIDKT